MARSRSISTAPRVIALMIPPMFSAPSPWRHSERAVGRDRRRGGRSESRQIRECRFPRTSGTREPQERTSPLPLSARCGRDTPVSLMPRLRLSPRAGLSVVMEQEGTVSRVVGGRSSRGRERERDALELWPCQSCGLPAAVVALALRLGPRAAPAPRRGSRSPAPAGSAGASWRSAPARAPRGRPWSPRAACPSAKPVISVVENQADRTASGQAPPGPKARQWLFKTRIAQPFTVQTGCGGCPGARSRR